MSDGVEFDPAAIDRAITHLNKVLELMDQRESQVAELQHVPQPGAAPSTRSFHGLLNQSMAHLRQQHNAFRTQVRNQITELTKTKRTYAATDATNARRFEQL